MKFSRRRLAITLAATSVIALGIAFVVSRPEKLPTQPTPPDVIVPAGFRYVGGDEFNGPDGSPPASVIIARDEASVSGCRVHNGALRLTASSTGDVSIKYDRAIDMRIPGRIQVRVRVLLPEFPESDSGSLGSIAEGSLSAITQETYLGLIMFSYDPALFSGRPEIEESVSERRIMAAAEPYHIYELQWKAGQLMRFVDGYYFPHANPEETVLPDSWLDSESPIPDTLKDSLCQWTRWEPYKYSHRLSFSLAPSLSKTSAPKIMEIDYIRIYQE